MKVYKLTKIAAIAAIVGGIGLAAPLTYQWVKDQEAIADPAVHIPAKAPLPEAMVGLVTGVPVQITIPSLDMTRQVIPGSYNPNDGEWTLTLDKAQYALPSVQPNNEEGNTLIYGHYRPEVFAYLHLIKPGAEAQVVTSNGYTFTYTYEYSQAFDPTNTSIFNYQGPPRLTVQTCSGDLFQHRQMYYFKYDGYTKNAS